MNFTVTDYGHRIDFSMLSRDKKVSVALRAHDAELLPATSCFGSLDESSRFFEKGSVGYSVTRDCCRFDGIELQTHEWKVRALAVDSVESSFFNDTSVFPAGSAVFDHALIAQRHEWHTVADMTTNQPENVLYSFGSIACVNPSNLH
jgi:hypothetical protein